MKSNPLFKLFIITFICCVLGSCADNSGSKGGQISNEQDMLAYGKNIYDVQCKLCHGPKGNAGVGGAKDLALTQLDETGVGDIVFHGKGAMPPFKERLGEPEINAVAKYVLSLKTK